MTESKFVTYKIYRLVDLHYPPGHSDYVRYVGQTGQELDVRFRNHLNKSRRLRCAAKIMKVKWFDFSKLSIQLVELVSEHDEVSSRERFWVELHQIAGYNLLNINLMNRKIFPEGALGPAGARRFISSRMGKLVSSNLQAMQANQNKAQKENNQ